MEAVFIVIGIIVLVIVVRLIVGGLDGDRVSAYVQSRGGELLEKRWSPFGRGWFAGDRARIYEIEFRDARGDLHRATCKTSLFGGVYLTEDHVVKHADPTRTTESLEAENQRLREEIEKLEQNGREQ